MSRYDPEKHHRRSIRLPGYDYAQAGVYYVTICTKLTGNLLAAVENGAARPTQLGRLVEACWLGIPEHFPGVTLDDWVVMPDHLHGIIVLDAPARHEGAPVRATHASPSGPPHPGEPSAPEVRAARVAPLGTTPSDHGPLGGGATHASPVQAGGRPSGPPSRSVGAIAGSFKAAVTRLAREQGLCHEEPLWLRGFYEHIIRDDADLARIRQYIVDNPLNWGAAAEP